MSFAKLLPTFVATLLLFTTAQGQTKEPPTTSAATTAAQPSWTWPKRLVELKFGEKTRYRDTDYWVGPILKKDGDAELLIYKGDAVRKRFLAGIGGQFAILDVDTPMPTCEGWGENSKTHGVRWLMSAFDMRSGGQVGYGWIYLEVYTTDPAEAKGEEVHRVSRRPGAPVQEYRYFGWAEKYDPKDATRLLEEAKALKE